MSEQRLPRKLAAILYADVAGYSRLTGEDEDATHRRLSESLDLISRNVERHRGRVMHYAGDAVLAMFAAVVDAVSCALAVQRELHGRHGDEPAERRIEFRIGVNLGDVIEDRGDIYGEGVNVAARLEGLAEPGGVCVSESVRTAGGRKLALEYEDLGEQAVKNIAAPVRAYRARLEAGAELPEAGEAPPPMEAPAKPAGSRARVAAAVGAVAVLLVVAGVLWWLEPWAPPQEPASLEGTAYPLPDKPSIAVLPFTNMSGDPEQDYFSDGISEDIITDLSQISGLGVISRNSSFAYRDTQAIATDVAEALNVGYVLEGSVRKVGDRVRITAQLVEATSGQSLWAERYDRRLVDIFALQDEIRNEIVSALSVELVGEEETNLSRKQPKSFQAYDLFLQGRRRYNEFTADGMKNAESLYSRAVELDPGFARAYGALGITLARSLQVAGAAADRDAQLARALEAVETAANLEPTSPQVQYAVGFVHMMRGEFREAAEAVEKSVSLSPNFADGWGLLALINNQLGRGDQALRFIRKGMALNPAYSYDFPYNEGRALYNLGEYEKAAESLLLALERNESAYNPRLFLIASYIRLGRLEDAEWEVSQLEISMPGITLSHLEQTFPMPEGEHRTRFFDDLRKAGMPE